MGFMNPKQMTTRQFFCYVLLEYMVTMGTPGNWKTRQVDIATPFDFTSRVYDGPRPQGVG